MGGGTTALERDGFSKEGLGRLSLPGLDGEGGCVGRQKVLSRGKVRDGWQSHGMRQNQWSREDQEAGGEGLAAQSCGSNRVGVEGRGGVGRGGRRGVVPRSCRLCQEGRWVSAGGLAALGLGMRASLPGGAPLSRRSLDWGSFFLLSPPACPFFDRGLHLAGVGSVWRPQLLSGQGGLRTLLAEGWEMGSPTTDPTAAAHAPVLFPGLLGSGTLGLQPDSRNCLRVTAFSTAH